MPDSPSTSVRPVRRPVRRVLVAGSAVTMLVGAAIGSGAFGGTPVEQAAGGALAADATPVAPAVPAFAIWSVIYAGLLGLALWQALPGRRDDARLRGLDVAIASSMLLNAAWLLAVQFGLLGLSVAVIFALVAVLGYLYRATTLQASPTRAGALLLDATMGLYLGWVSVAAIANTAAWLAALGVGPGLGERSTSGDVAGVVVLAVAAGLGVGLAQAGRGRVSFAVSMVWGLAWIAVGRLTGELRSPPVAVAALSAAAVIATAAAVARSRRPPTHLRG